jgi:hypothetical protein
MTTPDPIDINAVRNTAVDITYDTKGETFRDFVLAQADPDHDGVIHVGEEAGQAAGMLTKFEGDEPDALLTSNENFFYYFHLKGEEEKNLSNLEYQIEVLQHKNKDVNADAEAVQSEIMTLLGLKTYDLSSVDIRTLSQETKDKLKPLIDRALADAQNKIDKGDLLVKIVAARDELMKTRELYKKSHAFAYSD